MELDDREDAHDLGVVPEPDGQLTLDGEVGVGGVGERSPGRMKLRVVHEAADRAVHAELLAHARAGSSHLVARHRLAFRAAQPGYLGLDGVGILQREVRAVLFAEEDPGRASPVVRQLSGGEPTYREAHPFTLVASPVTKGAILPHGPQTHTISSVNFA